MDKNIKNLIEYSEGGIFSKEINKNNLINSTLFCMASGTQISEHTSTKQGFVYVLEGKGIFKLENKEIEMKEGVFIYMKENMIHSLKAEENTAFMLVLINNN